MGLFIVASQIRLLIRVLARMSLNLLAYVFLSEAEVVGGMSCGFDHDRPRKLLP